MSRVLIWLAFLALTAAAAAADAGPPPTTAPANTSPMAVDMKSLVFEFATGRAEVHATAALAIQLAPQEALPILEEALRTTTMAPPLHDALAKILATQKAARVRLADRTRATQQWTRATTIDAYETDGHHDARWDAPARQLLALFNKPGLTLDDVGALRGAARACLGAGCDDPLIVFLAARELEHGQAIQPDEARLLCTKAAQGLLASHYPASRTCLALEHAAALSLPPPPAPIVPGEPMAPRAPATAPATAAANGETAHVPTATIQEMLDASLAHLPAATREEGIPSDQLIDLALALVDDYTSLGVDQEGAFTRVYAVLDKAVPRAAARKGTQPSPATLPAASGVPGTTPKNPSESSTAQRTWALQAVPLVCKGIFYDRFSHEATSDATDEQSVAAARKLYRQRLSLASAALEKAWDIDPTDDRAPTEMIMVELSRASQIPKIEPWFLRAIQANPDSYRACVCRLLYINPRWAGRTGVELMWDFGHACARSWNYGAGIPLILPLVHRELARSTAYSDGRQYSAVYMRRPVVWKDAQYVFTQALQRQPDSAALHTAYAQYAAWCEQWGVASEELALLGDHYDTSQIGGEREFEALRRTVATRASHGGEAHEQRRTPAGQ